MAFDRLHRREFTLAFTLSALLTFALFYSTFEVPVILDKILVEYFPEVFFNVEAIERMLSILRPIGYMAFTVVVILIVLGFIAKKISLTFLGSVALYIPIFSYFAFAMFFLTGLGVLRSLWLPIIEFSPSILKLGSIAYLPFSIIPYAPTVGMVIVFIGLSISSFSTTTWLYGKFRSYELIDFWIYRYSRHPQYLGYIIWSYGLLVFVSYKTYVRGAFTTPPALLWLITAMIVIGVALLEEVEMIKKYGERYEEYRRRTPFMIPIPKLLTKIITLPMKIFGEQLKNTKEIVAAIILYTAIIIAISYITTLILEI